MRKAWTVLVVTFLASVAITVNRFQGLPVMQVLVSELDLGMAAVGSGLGVLAGPPPLGSILNGERWTLGSVCLGAVMGLGTIASVLAGERIRSI